MRRLTIRPRLRAASFSDCAIVFVATRRRETDSATYRLDSKLDFYRWGSSSAFCSAISRDRCLQYLHAALSLSPAVLRGESTAGKLCETRLTLSNPVGLLSPRIWHLPLGQHYSLNCTQGRSAFGRKSTSLHLGLFHSEHCPHSQRALELEKLGIRVMAEINWPLGPICEGIRAPRLPWREVLLDRDSSQRMQTHGKYSSKGSN